MWLICIFSVVVIFCQKFIEKQFQPCFLLKPISSIKKAFLSRKQKRESWHMSRTLFLWCLASVNQHLFTSTISNCLRTNKYYIVAGLSYQIFLNFEKFAYKRKKLRFNRLTHSWCRNDPWSCLRMYRCKVNVIWPGKYFLQRKMIIVCSPQ